MRGYYSSVFDARLSDYIDETISGLKFKIRFLRVSERHHTVAIASVNGCSINPIRTRIQHCNVQVADLNDMTLAYQRVKELGFEMALSVGQHTPMTRNCRSRDDAVGLRVGTRLESDRCRRVHLGTVDSSGISIWGHTQKDRRSLTHSGGSGLERSRCCTVKTVSPRSPGWASATTNRVCQYVPHNSAGRK